ncbi:MAG: PAS domain-containing protein [Bacteroidetes bacterium]|nr:PAS domain-containing protein [Bacteroidota bacterium]
MKNGNKSEAEILKLMHELEVHQIELEMQNEELIMARSAAQAATEKYTELYDFAPSGYFTLSKEGKIIDLNLCGSQMLGKERSLIINSPFEFFVSNNTKPIFNLFLEKVFNSKAKESCEITLSTNGYLPTYVHLFGMVTENGEQCLVTAIDITDRKREEDALRESEKKYHTLYTLVRLMSDTMPDMLWAKDINNQFIFTNRAVCENLLNAVDTSEPIGKTDIFFAYRERDSHPTNPDWHTFGELCINSDAITVQEMKKMQFDEYGNVKGKFLYLDVHKAPLFNEKNEFIGLVGSARDITERKQAEEALMKKMDELQWFHRLSVGRELTMIELKKGNYSPPL